MKNKWLLVLVLLTAAYVSPAQDLGLYQKKMLLCGSDTLPYRLLLPENFDPEKAYPLVVFLHGAGERGNNNEAQLTHGGKLFVRSDIRQQFPAIVVFPQCPANSFWSNVNWTYDSVTKKRDFLFPEEGEPTYAMLMVMQLVREIQKQYKVKQDQRYVMGLSMGGMGTFELVKRMPNTFAAAIPICGGSHPANARFMKQTAFWIFHGDADGVVPVALSRQMAEALQQYYTAADMQLTIYPGVNHNSWDNAFAEKELLPWLFSHQRK
ncbi:MAG: alpha/beta hydrolase-fold protein [Chitinophagaceae bacterium]|jgi:predicted peptidase|nr:alpha/beta hydrolase-fold protein [Chitinophagaceae bacterium]